VRRNGLRLLKMMDDLLALTLAEVGNLRLRMEMLDIGQLAHGLRMDLQQFVESKALDLRIDVAEGVVPVIGDAELIERVLVTFLGNAAKFSERGGKISLEICPAEHGGVMVIVSDTGAGIAADELPHIFEPFNQSNAESLGRPGGAGVGLALAKAVVELHGGTISVSSTEGVGTTVRMTVPPHPPESAPVERRRRGMEMVAGGGRGIETGLPEWHATFRTTSDYRLQALRDVTERPVRRSTTLAPAAAPRVLIVEDNPDMTRFLETILAPEYRTITASDANDGMRTAVSHLPDVVVTDLEMPGRSGMEMVQDLRSDPRTATIPIVMLASSDAAEHRASETGERPDAYVPKPFKVNDLTGAINALVQQQERGRSASMAERDEALLYMASGITDAASSALSQLADGDEGSDNTPARQVLQGLVESLTSFARPLDTSSVVVRGLTQITEEAVGRLDRVRVKSLSNASVRVDPSDFMDLLRLLVQVGLDGETPADSVSIEITEDASSTATIRIRDGGPGVPPEHAQRLFYPFNEAVDPDVSTALAGYRRRIERLNGRLVIEHGERGASSFLIRLPALRPFGKN
jgi:signal transduction histidine kinase